MDFYKGDIPILDDDKPSDRDQLHPKHAAYGMTGRDYDHFPEEMFAPPDSLQSIPESEWDARYDEQEANESSLEHIFLRGGKPAFVNLDQNGDGHCWAYSTGSSVMLDRLKRGLPIVRLNPHSVATLLKRFNGGWCGLSMQFVAEYGMAEEGNGPGQWPLHSNSASNATDTCRASMLKYKVTENLFDMSRRAYDQYLTARQLATCGFMNIPCPSDFNWWGHSVCQVRWVRIERGSWGPLILNSWKDWGRFGLSVLRGSKATANNAVATLATP